MKAFIGQATRVAGLAAALALGTSAEAQLVGRRGSSSNDGNGGLAIYGGIALPTGNFADGDLVKLGFQIGGQFLKPLQGPLDLRFNVEYTRFGIALPAEDGKFSNLSGMANLVYNINTTSSFHPYLLGGLGFGNGTSEFGGFGSSSESGLGVNVGAGYHFEVNGRNWFTEIRYVSQDAGGSEPVTYVPIVLGFRF